MVPEPAGYLDDCFSLESSRSIFWKVSMLVPAMHPNRELSNLQPRDQPRSVFETSKRCSFLKRVVYFACCSVVVLDAPRPISRARTSWHLAATRRNWSTRDSKYRPEVSSVSVRLLSSASRYIFRPISRQRRAQRSAPSSSEACYAACPDPDNFFLSISFWRTRCAWRMARYGPSCGRRASSSSRRTVVSWVRPFFPTQTIVVFIVFTFYPFAVSSTRLRDFFFEYLDLMCVYFPSYLFYYTPTLFYILSWITPKRNLLRTNILRLHSTSLDLSCFPLRVISYRESNILSKQLPNDPSPMEDSFSFFQQTMRPLRVLISLRIDREGKEGERENEKERDKLRGCTGSPGISLFLICIVALLFSVPLGCSANVHACAFLRS